MSQRHNFIQYPDKVALLEKYSGATVDQLPTPSVLIDYAVFKENCDKMIANAKRLECHFRPHLKTHKTVEGTLLQLGEGFTDRAIVSTMSEAWGILPQVQEGLINSVLLSMPLVSSAIEELMEYALKCGGGNENKLVILVDHINQLDLLLALGPFPWQIYVKIDFGYHRAGLFNNSPSFQAVVSKILDPNNMLLLYGFYTHAGQSYLSANPHDAHKLLLQEIASVNEAAVFAVEQMNYTGPQPLQLSVGATPTAHASSMLVYSKQQIETQINKRLYGELELHAGNYCCCDLQQVATNCCATTAVAATVLAEVVSNYTDDGRYDQLINAGVLALSRESGPYEGYGHLLKNHDWYVGKLSQEHGILYRFGHKKVPPPFMPIGSKVRILPQHACITLACHPYFFVIDENDKVVDIWVPFKYW